MKSWIEIYFELDKIMYEGKNEIVLYHDKRWSLSQTYDNCWKVCFFNSDMVTSITFKSKSIYFVCQQSA